MTPSCPRPNSDSFGVAFAGRFVRSRVRIRLVLLALLWTIGISTLLAQTPSTNQAATSYDALISEGNQFFKDGKLKEGYQDTMSAAAQDSKRFEAFALAAFILHKQGVFSKAKEILDEAISRAPSDKRDALLQFQKKIQADMASSPEAPPTASTGPQLSGEARRKYDALTLIIEDADKATSADERQKLLNEFLERSESFVQDNPQHSEVWILRAASAIELGRAKVGWLAGQKLIGLGASDSDDPKIRKVMASLDRKGWLVNEASQIERLQAATDSVQKKIKCARDAIKTANEQLEKLPGWLSNPSVSAETKSQITHGLASWRKYLEVNKSNLGKLQANLSSGCREQVVLDRCHFPLVKALDGMVQTGVSQAEADFFVLLEQAEATGDADIQFELASKFSNGEGVSKDEVKALKWYRKAAEQGKAEAQLSVGVAYEFGLGVAKDEAEARVWYSKAAEAGQLRAQLQLAELYWRGRGGSKNDANAVRWFRKALEQGNDDLSTQYDLALLLATSRDDHVRNGLEAVKLALNVCERKQYKYPWEVAGLAAAYAEIGDFENAKKYQQMAITMPNITEKQRTNFEARMKLFQAGMPFRAE